MNSALDLYLNQGRRVGYGQTSQTDGVQQLKNGGVCADAQREREDRCNCECRALAQRAQSKAQVLKSGLKPQRVTGVTRSISLTIRRHGVFAGRFLQQIIPPTLRFNWLSKCGSKISRRPGLSHLFGRWSQISSGETQRKLISGFRQAEAKPAVL